MASLDFLLKVKGICGKGEFKVNKGDKWLICTQREAIDTTFDRTYSFKRGEWHYCTYYDKLYGIWCYHTDIKEQNIVLNKRRYTPKDTGVVLLHQNVATKLRATLKDTIALLGDDIQIPLTQKGLVHYINHDNHYSYWNSVNGSMNTKWEVYTAIDHSLKKIVAFAIIPKGKLGDFPI